ncbi:hypothetical protein [Curtobacterium sp. MCJR17_043]|uniref:hypothetical protein n=1 Tax=Curtobacterium sp. MCJR17_043 TaxID=2175660 RepID=UPI0024DF69BB|nr:hypothetical protein [Curtobacterium sp. MCJR17_043]WIB36309.1 hypothetical protein DEJ15_03840 [Curtobacterium sp. MCJR17_043]
MYSTDAAGRLGLGLPTADLFAGSGGTRYALLLDLAGSADNTTPAVLSAAEAGAQGVDGTWRSSVDIGTVRAGSAATLATFQEQIAATTPDATVNGYGAFARTAPGTVVGILGNETRSYFTPEPTAVVGGALEPDAVGPPGGRPARRGHRVPAGRRGLGLPDPAGRGDRAGLQPLHR